MPVIKICISVDEDVFKKLDKQRGDVKRSTFISRLIREGMKK